MARYGSLVQRRWLTSQITHRSFDLEDAAVNDDSRAELEALYNDAVRCMTEAVATQHDERRARYLQRHGPQASEAAFGDDARRKVLRTLCNATWKRIGPGHRDRLLRQIERDHADTLEDLDADVSEVRRLLAARDTPADGTVAARVDVAEATASIDALRATWASDLDKVNARRRAAVQDAERAAIAARAETTDSAGRVNYRRLIDSVLARDRCCGGKYASVVTSNADTSRTVHSEPVGVATTLVDCFDHWMGGKGRKFWYQRPPSTTTTTAAELCAGRLRRTAPPALTSRPSTCHKSSRRC